jgi:hypothetical protein
VEALVFPEPEPDASGITGVLEVALEEDSKAYRIWPIMLAIGVLLMLALGFVVQESPGVSLPLAALVLSGAVFVTVRRL